MPTIAEQVEQQRIDLARGKHTPTVAMQGVAKRGLAQMKDQGQEVPDETAAAGRKVASGQQLSDDHVKAMAAYHAAHEYDCTTDSSVEGTQDMLWGGAPGAAWSSARSAAIDVSAYSDDGVELAEDDVLSLEIFVRDGFGEPTQLADEEGLIWAPILRSGTLATRPGPYGQKIDQPLVIVPGLASDPHKEIGLQNLHDNFKAGAVQHVTIPTTHENGVLENNGYIVDVRIDDSAVMPGEKVLMGAHKITEPDALGRVQRGSVANRSCGILHDYVDTTTGMKYDQVIEHVALTNKPWVRGMAAYGDLSEADLSERKVVPMLLSESPKTQLNFSNDEWSGEPIVDGKLNLADVNGLINSNAVRQAATSLARDGSLTTAQKRALANELITIYRGVLLYEPPADLIKLAAVSTQMTQSELTKELLSDVQWGDEMSLNHIRNLVSAQLSEYRNASNPGGPPYYYVMDVTPNKALVRIEYGDPDGVDDAWVVPLSTDDVGVKLAPFADWTSVTQEWVTDEDAEKDKQELGTILGGGTMPVPDPVAFALSEAILLSIPQADRMKAAKAGNALPDGSYPIRNVKELHAAAVLAASGHGDVKAATALIRKRAKELGVDVKTLPGFNKTNASEQRLQLPQERHNQQGGLMPTIQEALDRLELSDEAKAVFKGIADDNQRLSAQLSEATKQSRTDKITGRVKDLQDKGFSPGFCSTYETIALGDDGAPAAVLHLSEGGSVRDVEHTATELMDRLIAAMPFDESGKLALAGQGNLLESPITERPNLTDNDADKATEGMSPGDKLIHKWSEGTSEHVAQDLKTRLAEPSATPAK